MRTGGTVPNFKAPGRKWPSGKMWTTAAFCLILPPVGLIMLWGGAKCPVRGKISLSAVALASMVAILTVIMTWGGRSGSPLPQQTVSYQYADAGAQNALAGQPALQPTAAPVAPAAPATDTQAGAAELPEGVVPANPMG